MVTFNWELLDFIEYTKQVVVSNEELDKYEDKIKHFTHKLPSKQRRVVEMRFVGRLTLSEIADRLGKNMNYVKVTQRRAIRSLKKLIAQENYGGICTPRVTN